MSAPVARMEDQTQISGNDREPGSTAGSTSGEQVAKALVAHP